MEKSWQFKCCLSDNYQIIYDQEVINDICDIVGLHYSFTAIAAEFNATDWDNIYLCMQINPETPLSLFEHISTFKE